jgi:two-component system sensor histidine kinase CpxA
MTAINEFADSIQKEKLYRQRTARVFKSGNQSSGSRLGKNSPSSAHRTSNRKRKRAEFADIKIGVADDIEVTAQPELLSRAIANVVRNAVRYAGDAGETCIEATNGNNQVQIEIADNGAGVPEESLEKLFDPLYRVESDRARQTGGTGLGLAIVKTCVEACGGKVYARNQSPHGLSVIITLKN